jgi:hypothetical protein
MSFPAPMAIFSVSPAGMRQAAHEGRTLDSSF